MTDISVNHFPTLRHLDSLWYLAGSVDCELMFLRENLATTEQELSGAMQEIIGLVGQKWVKSEDHDAVVAERDQLRANLALAIEHPAKLLLEAVLRELDRLPF